MSDFPQVFTFYSFKGGVGRSMAVLNVAYALAGRGRNVLVLDMDLEAPGLSGFLRRHSEIGEFARGDIIDLVQWASQFSAARQSGGKPDRAALPPLSDYAVSVVAEKLDAMQSSRGELGRVDVIPVDEERDYYGRLTALGIGGLDHETLRQIGSLLNVWLKSREFAVEVPDYYGPAGERTAKYDYVLVDSRTGVTEIGGLCIGPLSDHLLVFTALNDQNVAGTARFLREVGVLESKSGQESALPKEKEPGVHRLDPKPTMIVATPVPSGEIEMKKRRLAELRDNVGTVVSQLSYHPQLALMETVFVRDHPKEYLAIEYDQLVNRLMRQAKDGTDFSVTDFFDTFNESPRDKQRQLAEQAIRYCSTSGGSPVLLHVILASIPPASVTEDVDFVLLDRVCRLLAGRKKVVDFGPIDHWANLLSQWALHSTQPDQRALRLDAAMRRYAQVLDADDSTPEQKARALFNRGVTKGQLEDHQGAIADYTAVLEMPDAPAEQKAKALTNRGVTKGQLEDHQGAIADYTAVLEMPDAPAEQKAKALYNRGVTKGQLEDHQGAIADYTAVLEMPDAPAEQKAQALTNRGVTKGQLEDHQGAIADYTAVLEMPDAPAEQKAKALYNRGVTKGQLEDHQGAIADYTAVLEMPDAPAEQKAKALYNRGVRKGQLEDHQGAIADYTAVLEMPDAPAEQKAQALFNRGVRKGQLEDHQGAIADYTAVLEMPDAPAEQKAQALSNRGWTQYMRSRFTEAIVDFREAIGLDENHCNARGNLAIALLVSGQTEESLAAYDQALSLANLDNISDMEQDLTEALEKHGSVNGAEQIRERIAKRRVELEK